MLFTGADILDIFGLPPKPKLARLALVQGYSTGRDFLGNPDQGLMGQQEGSEGATPRPATRESPGSQRAGSGGDQKLSTGCRFLRRPRR